MTSLSENQQEMLEVLVRLRDENRKLMELDGRAPRSIRAIHEDIDVLFGVHARLRVLEDLGADVKLLLRLWQEAMDLITARHPAVESAASPDRGTLFGDPVPGYAAEPMGQVAEPAAACR